MKNFCEGRFCFRMLSGNELWVVLVVIVKAVLDWFYTLLGYGVLFQGVGGTYQSAREVELQVLLFEDLDIGLCLVLLLLHFLILLQLDLLKLNKIRAIKTFVVPPGKMAKIPFLLTVVILLLLEQFLLHKNLFLIKSNISLPKMKQIV